jgi:hypothetical protein
MWRELKASGGWGGGLVMRKSLDFQSQILPPIRGRSGKDVACLIFSAKCLENFRCCVHEHE